MRILLVEDDSGIARFISKGLRENTYAIDVAVNGEQALYQVDINTYDLIILDVMMPIKDGFEVCEELRSKGNSVPILMLTAKDAVEDRINGLDLGADDYLAKPFEFGELLARMRALLRRPKGEILPSIIKIKDLEIDTKAQKILQNGEQILLTTKEFAMLEYFIRNKDRVIGREEISEHVWDETFDPFSNTIEVYVNRLRRKLNSNLIQTRRGAGYIFETPQT